MLHQTYNFASLSWQSAFEDGFSQLARLKDVSHRHAYTIDYWHQHAIRTVISNLSFAWVSALLPEAIALLLVQHQVLLTTIAIAKHGNLYRCAACVKRAISLLLSTAPASVWRSCREYGMARARPPAPDIEGS